MLSVPNAPEELIASNFQGLLPKLREDCGIKEGDNGKDEVKELVKGVIGTRLKELVEAANDICVEIIQKLENIKRRRAKEEPLKSLYATWKEMRMKENFESLSVRLTNLRNQICLHINILLIQQQNSIQSALVDFTKAHQDYVQLKSHAIIHATGEGGREKDAYRVEWQSGFDELSDLGKTLQDSEPHYEASERTDEILHSLYFSQFAERRETIPAAHMKTCEWIFKNDVANFEEWLGRSNAPVYWIAGKAGSGKSTLMKYIRTHSTVKLGLQRWAGENKVFIASHFFWSAGTLMQKSQEGLLRTLNHQILTQFPGLAHKVFPERWKTALQPIGARGQEVWTISELTASLTQLLSLIENCSVLIFVDGLDEYSGEIDNLIEFLDMFGRFTNVKLCVSSRPWLEFSDAFSDSPWKLYLQDLTRKDIEQFTRDTLEANRIFRSFRSKNEKASLELISSITERAEGVFLWVHLVTRSLLRGIVNSDDMADLQKRLDEYPRGLESFFERMFDTIDEFYRKRTAKVLLVLAHARVPLPLATFYFLDSQDGSPFDPKGFLKNWPYVDAEEAEAVEHKKRQLIAQFKDFINIHKHPTKGALFGFSVGFIHLTAIDFITQDHTLERLYERSGPAFDPAVALFEVSLEQFKIFSHFWKFTYLHPYLKNWFLSTIYYAREIEVRRNESVTEQLNELQDLLSSDKDHMPFRKRPYFAADWWHGSLESLAIDTGLWLYAKDMVELSRAEKALRPKLCIELESDFVVREVSDSRWVRRVQDSERPLYSSTLQMVTAAEEQYVSPSREGQHKPLPLIEATDSIQSEQDLWPPREETQEPATYRAMRMTMTPVNHEVKVSRLKRFRAFWKFSRRE
ncbi:hypothetical protein E8E14_012203 [Neopestalotiopsis sp. 37M]|nr:hypothetical protein E8E14_012203 [Neopestalotiopsis sp. 37M]